MKGTLKVDKPISNKSSHQVQYNSKMIGEKRKTKKRRIVSFNTTSFSGPCMEVKRFKYSAFAT